MNEIIVPGQINSVIFDFDGTLCFDRYFSPLGSDALDTIHSLLFGENSAQWADPWMNGDLTSRDIASYLSKHLPESEGEILSALRNGCARMSFRPVVYHFALHQRGRRKTALITANMDILTEVVVPAHGLDKVFDLVLNTADHHTLDKRVLWRKALNIFGPEHSFTSTLLVEDSLKMVELFESLGGYAYRYEGDEALQAWLEETGFAEEMQDH